MPSAIRLIAALAAPLALPAIASAQQPTVVDGRVVPASAGATGAAAVRAFVAAPGRTEPAWIGYRVPMVAGDRAVCCGSWNGASQAACRLEPDGPAGAQGTSSGTRARIEPSRSLQVFYRVVDRAVERVVAVSADCEVDAGGRTITWLAEMPVRESVTLLQSLVGDATSRREHLSDGAVAAIALHDGPDADAALQALLAPARPLSVRRQVAFWLGNARGTAGLKTLETLLQEDGSAELRKAAVFGVSQSREPEAAPLLASLARQHQDPAVRGEALFWAAQSGRPDAARLALEALDTDTSPEVRKKAIFALSQLHDQAGVDALIRVARTHTDPAVRSEAIFWLGQKAGAAAVRTINERIAADPETEVKKRAVFALSQLPADQSVPLLIDVARTNGNAEVRKQAMFWLGQSKDPRAVDFFADVLGGRVR